LLGDAASRRGSSQKPVVEAAEVLP
jgi:hypothetical protein